MSDAPPRPAASTPEALHAIIADAFSRGDIDAFLAAYEEGASVVVPPDGTCAHGLDQIRAATAPIIALRPHMTSVACKTLRSSELALTHARWELDGTAPDGTRIQLSGTGIVVSRRGPDGAWRIVLDDETRSRSAGHAHRRIRHRADEQAAAQRRWRHHRLADRGCCRRRRRPDGRNGPRRRQAGPPVPPDLALIARLAGWPAGEVSVTPAAAPCRRNRC
jgi:ketosteroid isomerase-like protein